MADKTLTPLQQAALALRRMRSRVDMLEEAARAPIAVIGLACRYPGGADDGERLWQNLVRGVDATCEIPADRWDVDAHYDPRPGVPGKMYTRRGGFVDRVDEFDAQFFRIAPRDAIGIDPQQRLLLQTVWHALEDAGLPPPSLQGRKVGVFLGISTNDYSNLLSKTAFGSSSNAGAGAGNAASVASGRISYTFDFQGPCVAVDTACSSSLVATHLAVQALRNGECELAVVAGVNLMLAPDITVNFCQARMLSPDGRCKTFDASADGYARAEGCGVVILRRLADAGADRVRAVIAGSAINQDGRSAGLTAPSGPAQEAVIRAAVANAGLTPAEVDAIEAHGTGTGLGDPIEMHALAAVFRERNRPLFVGSIKSNMGHAEAAAGVGGLIKAVLMAERGQIAPSLHFDRLNPHIDLNGVDIRIPVAAQAIPPRAVGVSSFGFSGTNAHIVVTPPPAPDLRNEPEIPAGHVPRLLISARTPDALAELVTAYRRLLDANPSSFPDVCHSAATGRARLPWWICVERPEDLANAEPQHGRHPDLDPQPGRRLPLPHYPFERQRYWIDTSPAPAAVAVTALPKGSHPLLGRRLHLPFSEERRFETSLYAIDPAMPWLAEHRVLDQVVLPAASLVELLHAADPDKEIRDLDLLLPIRLPDQPSLHLQLILAADGSARIVSWNAADEAAKPVLHARAKLADPVAPPAGHPSAGGGTPVPLAAFFAELERRGIAYGPAFRGLRDLRRIGLGEVAAGLALPEEAGAADGFTLHPALLDAALQAVAAALPADDSGATIIPARLARARLLRRPGAGLTVHATARQEGASILAELMLTDAEGLVAFLAGLEFRPISAAMLADAGHGIAVDAFYTIEPEPCPRIDGLLPPDFLPSAQDLCAGLAPLSAEAGQRFGIGVYAETAPALDRITAAFIHRALVEMGLTWQPGRLLTPAALAAELGVADRHRRLLRRLLAILAGAGMLEAVGPAWRILSAPLATDPAAELDRLIDAHPGAAAELALVRRAGPRLADVLADRVDPLTLLFPDEGGGAADLYASSAYARTINALLSETAKRLHRSLPAGRVLRVLEIGAGTGGATGAVLEGLPEGSVRYCFTDLSQLFLDAAQVRFARRELDVRRLDIEQDPQVQGFAPGSQDLILAANVLHATRDIAESVAHAASLLAPGGLLVLVETTKPRSWVDIVFGLTEGWWRFADRSLRSDHPLLSRAQWLEVLTAAGLVADALPAGEIILARKSAVPVAVPPVRLLGDPGSLALPDTIGAPSALFVAPPAPATFAGQLDLFEGLLASIRRLNAEPEPPALTILADGSLGHAGLAGFLRTLRLEQPKLQARLIEAPPSERALLDELAGPDGESHLLWRENQRLAPRLRPAPAPEPLGKVEGSWLVTGGSGEVGRVAAAWLARHGASRIVLVSRSRPEALPDLPVPVDCHAADVADADVMAAILAGLPDLRGIVHAAGLLDDAPVQQQSRERFAAVMRAKIEGALVLDRLTRTQPDVRLVLFASVAGVLGSAEQANHAAASSFLDALAQERSRAGLPTVAVDWGVWREIGAAARLGVVDRAEKLGLGSLSPAEGEAAFAAALGNGAPAQLVVLPKADWPRFLGQFPDREKPALLQGILAVPRQAAAAVPSGQAASPAERLCRIVAEVVGLPAPADPDTPLPDFGLDSLMAVEIRNRVQRELGVEVGVRELLEGATIAAIADRAGSQEPAAPVRRIEPDPAHRYDPFPLTEIQQAYWIGRGDSLELGNVGCYLYTEVELRDVDLARLEQAWNQLVRRHDMLRAVILPDGRQQILKEVPPYRIAER
ncbi:type I polyketide synthase, partial [Geminicoccus flavidas]|uniref:type I polyketide synthase n=1 Tax=Geminicoccus flavidas TaxID=2506407 RepID=UPI00135A02B9